MTRATGRTDSEIHSFSHWVIMAWATERTDSEIHSFSHRVIMTRTTERTDSEIHSFSHRAIMTRAMERTASEIHLFSHWAIMTRAMESTDSEIHSLELTYWPILEQLKLTVNRIWEGELLHRYPRSLSRMRIKGRWSLTQKRSLMLVPMLIITPVI